METDEGFRSGFACFVGRPNTGKSTLTNAMVGEKVAITSSRPQTTRHAVRGVVHRPDSQLVLIDTPGLHRPRTLLGQRLNDLVRATWSEVDVVAFCTPADEPVGRGDRFVVESLATLARTPSVAVVTKTDLVSGDRLLEHLAAVGRLGAELGLEWGDVVPVSALTGDGVDLLHRLLVGRLPLGPAFYPDGEWTDEPEEVLVAELIREAALEDLRDELPHSLAVVVDEMVPRDDRRTTRCSTSEPRCTWSAAARSRSSSADVVSASNASARLPADTSRRCSAPRCSWTCTSRWPRSGSETRSNYGVSGSDRLLRGRDVGSEVGSEVGRDAGSADAHVGSARLRSRRPRRSFCTLTPLRLHQSSAASRRRRALSSLDGSSSPGSGGTSTSISLRSTASPTSPRLSPLQKRPGSYQFSGFTPSSSPMSSYVDATSSAQ